MTPKFAIVTESYDAVAPWPFMSQARRLRGYKSAAYKAAEMIRESAYQHPALGWRFKGFSIYDSNLYEVAYITESGKVYYDEATNGLGEFSRALHYILKAALNAVQEVKQNNVRRDSR